MFRCPCSPSHDARHDHKANGEGSHDHVTVHGRHDDGEDEHERQDGLHQDDKERAQIRVWFGGTACDVSKRGLFTNAEGKAELQGDISRQKL